MWPSVLRDSKYVLGCYQHFGESGVFIFHTLKMKSECSFEHIATTDENQIIQNPARYIFPPYSKLQTTNTHHSQTTTPHTTHTTRTPHYTHHTTHTLHTTHKPPHHTTPHTTHTPPHHTAHTPHYT
jgi:hypothetical protein